MGHGGSHPHPHEGQCGPGSAGEMTHLTPVQGTHQEETEGAGRQRSYRGTASPQRMQGLDSKHCGYQKELGLERDEN